MDLWFVAALIVAVLAFLILLSLIRAVTVYEFERGLKYKRGRFQGLLGPGLYWLFKPFSEIQKVDIRPAFASITGQEVLSSDGVTLKVSLAAQYQIVGPEVAVNRVADYQSTLYLELQLALREIIGSEPIDDVLAKRADFGRLLLEKTADSARAMGLELLQVEIKDIMFPGELKKIFSQVVKARQEGLAALEKARGETAALRNLANAARLMDANPNLMQLRLLQVMGQTSGNTVVLGMHPSSPVPIPAKGKPEIESAEEAATDEE